MKRFFQFVLPPILVLCLVAGIVLRIRDAYAENTLNVYSRPDLEPVYVDNGEPDLFDSDLALDSKMAMGPNVTQDFSASDRNANDSWEQICVHAGLAWPTHLIYGHDPYIYGRPKNDYFPLPCDIHYYVKEGENYELIHVDKAGKEVRFQSMNMLLAGYIATSAPTRDRGWRLICQPYSPDGPWPDNEAIRNKETPFYYVPLSDLEPVAEYLVETEGEYLRQCVDLEGRVTADTTDEELARILLFYVDSELYRTGIYRSPDFYQPYWDGVNIALAVLAGLLLLWWGYWLYRGACILKARREHRKP